MKWHQSIEFKIILSVAATTGVISCLIAYMLLTVQARQLNDTTLKSAARLSETIKKSIRIDMIENRKENAYRIMETIGEQEGIEKVRIYSSEGRIIFSTDKQEQGSLVDQKAEACYACHSEAQPLERLSTTARNRVFSSGNGSRVLGMINPMYNEVECSSTRCHVHPESQKVLGVIDVTMSLADMDMGIAAARRQTVYLSLLSVFSISIIVVFALMIFVGRPVKELVLGTRKVAEGDLEYRIPIASDDEMGALARSFNDMTSKLKEANQEITNWVRTLEHRVEDRTRELRNTQSQLVHAERLATLGKIAATVAHEINNPLSGVFTYVKLMERRIGEGKVSPEDIGKYREYLSTISREVQRTSSIVMNLLDFTRPKDPSRKSVNLNRVVEESISIVRGKLGSYGISLENRMEPLPEILADPSQIQQVFINIIVNACEAMNEGGALTIRSGRDVEGRTVSVSFADTGPGISPEDLAKVFDPFFTTKEKGTGLGLSVAHGIVTRHSGRIEVTSSGRDGTVMTVVLPET
jgi:two-component system, NtrC family, sensor kinase